MIDLNKKLKGAGNHTSSVPSAIDWIIEYHKPKKLNPIKEAHHKTLIDENLDTYDWLSIRGYIFNLIPKIITVSIETMRIYDELVEH